MTPTPPERLHDDRSYQELGKDEARARRRADAIAAQAASAIGADIYVTRRPYLHAITWDLASGVLVATPDDVLPLISLYLRTQGEFITYRSFDGNATSKTTKGLFYWVGVREFLPAGWHWFARSRRAMPPCERSTSRKTKTPPPTPSPTSIWRSSR
jgi:hypothetical protein